LLKNCAVVPKALWLAGQARHLGVNHIHAQWAATSATCAMIASIVADLPWTMTAHRWDIREDNLIGEKMRRARGVRAISRMGAEALSTVCPSRASIVRVGRVGVKVPAVAAPMRADRKELVLLTTANLVEVKGHSYLLEALALVRRRGFDVRVEFAGDGQLRKPLAEHSQRLGLGNVVTFLGVVPHEALLSDLVSGRWDAVVLPSIRTEDGEEEGIPVALMEAMAAGVPIIATRTGAIGELVDEGAGILVPEREPHAIQEAIASLYDLGVAARIASAGRARIAHEYEVSRTARALMAMINEERPSKSSPSVALKEGSERGSA